MVKRKLIRELDSDEEKAAKILPGIRVLRVYLRKVNLSKYAQSKKVLVSPRKVNTSVYVENSEDTDEESRRGKNRRPNRRYQTQHSNENVQSNSFNEDKRISGKHKSKSQVLKPVNDNDKKYSAGSMNCSLLKRNNEMKDKKNLLEQHRKYVEDADSESDEVNERKEKKSKNKNKLHTKQLKNYDRSDSSEDESDEPTRKKAEKRKLENKFKRSPQKIYSKDIMKIDSECDRQKNLSKNKSKKGTNDTIENECADKTIIEKGRNSKTRNRSREQLNKIVGETDSKSDNEACDKLEKLRSKRKSTRNQSNKEKKANISEDEVSDESTLLKGKNNKLGNKSRKTRNKSVGDTDSENNSEMSDKPEKLRSKEKSSKNQSKKINTTGDKDSGESTLEEGRNSKLGNNTSKRSRKTLNKSVEKADYENTSEVSDKQKKLENKGKSTKTQLKNNKECNEDEVDILNEKIVHKEKKAGKIESRDKLKKNKSLPHSDKKYHKEDIDESKSDNSDENISQKNRKRKIMESTRKSEGKNKMQDESAQFFEYRTSREHDRNMRVLKKVKYPSEEDVDSSSSDDSIISPKPLVCNQCKVPFKTDFSLQCHLRHKHHIEEFKCVICLKLLESYMRYLYHMETYHPERGRYPCDYGDCKKSYHTSKQLREHKKKHYPFMCKFCKKGYVKKDQMHEHVAHVHK